MTRRAVSARPYPKVHIGAAVASCLTLLLPKMYLGEVRGGEEYEGLAGAADEIAGGPGALRANLQRAGAGAGAGAGNGGADEAGVPGGNGDVNEDSEGMYGGADKEEHEDVFQTATNGFASNGFAPDSGDSHATTPRQHSGIRMRNRRPARNRNPAHRTTRRAGAFSRLLMDLASHATQREFISAGAAAGPVTCSLTVSHRLPVSPFILAASSSLDGHLLSRFDLNNCAIVRRLAKAGLAAAFGAPIGGVLFSLEEASSFWSRKVMWRSFICAAAASFMLAMLERRGNPGMLFFGGIKPTAPLDYLHQLPFFVITAAAAGVAGVLFHQFQVWLDTDPLTVTPLLVSRLVAIQEPIIIKPGVDPSVPLFVPTTHAAPAGPYTRSLCSSR